jgi:hypothetical protein
VRALKAAVHELQQDILRDAHLSRYEPAPVQILRTH